MKRTKSLLVSTLLLLTHAGFAQEEQVKPIPAEEPKLDRPVSLFDDLMPVLEAKCLACHSSVLTRGKLLMEEYDQIMKGGKSGKIVVPGKSQESLLFLAAARMKAPHMPPPEKKSFKPLTPKELGILKKWIDEGAKDDTDAVAAEETLEWIPLANGFLPVIALSLSPNGELVAAGRANQLQIYEVASGEQIATLRGHRDIIQSVMFSPDGRFLASGGFRNVTIWNVPQHEELRQFRDFETQRGLAAHGSAIVASAQTADGRILVTIGDDAQITAWDIATGNKRRTMGSEAGPQKSVAISPDGTRIVTGGADGKVNLWSVFGLTALEGHSGPVNACAFNASGDWVITASQDQTIRIWETATGKTLKELKDHASPVRALVCGNTAIYSAHEDGNLVHWNLDTGAVVRKISHGGGAVLALDLASDGATLASSGADKNIKLWNAADGKAKATLALGDVAASLRFSGDGTRIAAGSNAGLIKVWDASSKTLLATHQGHVGAVNGMHFDSDLTRLISVSADRTVREWKADDKFAELHRLEGMEDRVISLAFSPDGQMLATGSGEPSRSGEVTIWKVDSGEKVGSLKEPHSDTVFGLEFSPDGRLLATCAADKMVKVFDVRSLIQVRKFEGHTHHVMDVSWKSDGTRLVSSGADNALKVWNMDTGEQARSIGAHGKQVTSVQFIKGGNNAVSCGGDSLVRQFDTNNGRRVRDYGASDFQYCVSLDNSGTIVAAGGQDSVIRIWTVANGKLVREIKPPAAGSVTAN